MSEKISFQKEEEELFLNNVNGNNNNNNTSLSYNKEERFNYNNNNNNSSNNKNNNLLRSLYKPSLNNDLLNMKAENNNFSINSDINNNNSTNNTINNNEKTESTKLERATTASTKLSLKNIKPLHTASFSSLNFTNNNLINNNCLNNKNDFNIDSFNKINKNTQNPINLNNTLNNNKEFNNHIVRRIERINLSFNVNKTNNSNIEQQEEKEKLKEFKTFCTTSITIHLKELILNNCSINDNQIIYLMKYLQIHSICLTLLSLENNQFTSSSMSFIGKYWRNTAFSSLETLNLSKNKIEDFGLSILVDNLTTISVSNNTLSSLQLGKRDNLQKENLQNNLQNELEYDLENKFGIKHLDFSEIGITKSGLETFVKKFTTLFTKHNNNVTLETFKLSGNTNISNLCALNNLIENNSSLKHFDLYNNNIKHIYSHFTTLKNSLTNLNLGKNKLDDKGLKLLSKLISSSKCLKYLDLSENNFSEIGCNFLADALLVNYGLVYLNLSYNHLNFTVCTRILVCLKSHPTISFLDLSHNSFSTLLSEEIIFINNQLQLFRKGIGISEMKLAISSSTSSLTSLKQKTIEVVDKQQQQQQFEKFIFDDNCLLSPISPITPTNCFFPEIQEVTSPTAPTTLISPTNNIGPAIEAFSPLTTITPMTESLMNVDTSSTRSSLKESNSERTKSSFSLDKNHHQQQQKEEEKEILETTPVTISVSIFQDNKQQVNNNSNSTDTVNTATTTPQTPTTPVFNLLSPSNTVILKSGYFSSPQTKSYNNSLIMSPKFKEEIKINKETIEKALKILKERKAQQPPYLYLNNNNNRQRQSSFLIPTTFVTGMEEKGNTTNNTNNKEDKNNESNESFVEFTVTATFLYGPPSLSSLANNDNVFLKITPKKIAIKKKGKRLRRKKTVQALPLALTTVVAEKDIVTIYHSDVKLAFRLNESIDEFIKYYHKYKETAKLNNSFEMDLMSDDSDYSHSTEASDVNGVDTSERQNNQKINVNNKITDASNTPEDQTRKRSNSFTAAFRKVSSVKNLLIPTKKRSPLTLNVQTASDEEEQDNI
ncbi:hypothetical protein ABK040_013045 [Willaertia magna]